MKITNITGISLPMAVWLASDDYDFVPQSKAISATAILKPIRQILLKERLTTDTYETPDVSSYIASRLGTSIHDGIEKAWTKNYKTSLRKLGYPDALIDQVKINPDHIETGDIPVWLEQRAEREIMGYSISGKFDMVLEGVLQDFKSTSVYAFIMGSKDADYCLQGSIYKWIHQDKVTADYMNIQFIFTDWSGAQARQQPDKYPQQRVKEHRVDLMSVAETEAWLINKIKQLENAASLEEHEIPRCSDADLWRGKTAYKYFSNPEKTDGKSTKNFDTLNDANLFAAEKGKGVVITIPGKVKACGYCPAFPICTQKDEYEHD